MRAHARLDMLFRTVYKKLAICLSLFVLTGCSSTPNYYKPRCANSDLLCLALAVANVVSQDSAKTCADKKGAAKTQCVEKVDEIKKRIKNASQK